MKLDLEPLAVRETAARISAPDPAHAGRRPLAAALRGAVRHLRHSCARPHEQPHEQDPYEHPYDHLYEDLYARPYARPRGESEV
ncbi:hypothetical protein [Streptomyces sp. PD-S100-1]|uniref:hypothetical protein n=1 Tax=Streptomyces sp. PD-S100-1 TaxID=3394351 RepID=UPI0039BD7CA8